MNVNSVDEGLAKLSRIVAEGPEKRGQFHRASILLEATVKLYAANIDALYPQVLDFKLNLTKGVFSRYV